MFNSVQIWIQRTSHTSFYNIYSGTSYIQRSNERRTFHLQLTHSCSKVIPCLRKDLPINFYFLNCHLIWWWNVPGEYEWITSNLRTPECAPMCKCFYLQHFKVTQQNGTLNSEVSFSAWEWLFQPPGGYIWGLRDSFVRGTCEHKEGGEKWWEQPHLHLQHPGNTSHCVCTFASCVLLGLHALSAGTNTPVPSALQFAKASDCSNPGPPVSTGPTELGHNTITLVMPTPRVFLLPTGLHPQAGRTRIHFPIPGTQRSARQVRTDLQMRSSGWLETPTSGATYAAAPEGTTLTPHTP